MKKSLLSVFLLISALAFAQDSQKWQADIDRFKQEDSLQPPSQGGIVFTGSSSVRMWQSLAKDFPGYDILNRGFGGSTIADAIYYFDDLIGKYHPRQVVFYAGDNDIAAGMTAKQVFEDFKAFAGLMQEREPNAELLYLSIKPSLSRWEAYPEMARANRYIREYCKIHPKLRYVDVSTPMLVQGKPGKDLFLADGLHMNEKGYRIWKKVLKPYLKK